MNIHDQRPDRWGHHDFLDPTGVPRPGRDGTPPGGVRFRSGGRRGPLGPGEHPSMPGAWPGGPGFGPGGHRGRGRGRAGRGDVRAAILLLLADQPMHGYQIIQEIDRRSAGTWQPSPGAVYPALNLLQDEGLVEISSEGGRRLATLTEEGRAYATERADELGDPFQEAAGRGRGHRDVRDALGAVAGALHQVYRTGTPRQIEEAAVILDRARRDLYLLLAGPASTTEAPVADADPAGLPDERD